MLRSDGDDDVLQLFLYVLQFFVILLLLVVTEVALVVVIHLFHDKVSSSSTWLRFYTGRCSTNNLIYKLLMLSSLISTDFRRCGFFLVL